jgi:hypothetical protein
MQDVQKINSMTLEEVIKYTLNEIYKNLNIYREMLNNTKFLTDDIAESAIGDYFFYHIDPTIEDENRVDEKLNEVLKY